MEYDHEIRYADGIRTMINQESSMVVNRMNWMIVLQGLLLSACATLLKPDCSSLRGRTVLIGCLAVIGIGVAISARCEFRFNERAIKEILERWDRFKATRTQEQLQAMPPAFAGGENVVRSNSWESFLSSRRLFPYLFSLAWTVIFLVTLFGSK